MDGMPGRGRGGGGGWGWGWGGKIAQLVVRWTRSSGLFSKRRLCPPRRGPLEANFPLEITY